MPRQWTLSDPITPIYLRPISPPLPPATLLLLILQRRRRLLLLNCYDYHHFLPLLLLLLLFLRSTEAFALYGSGIDLLLQGAREEPAEQRRQTLMREASVHMSRAENIKAALAPPAPPGSRFASGGGGSEATGAGKARGKARGGSGQGKTALSRPVPTGSDVTGSIRVRAGGGGCRGAA